MKKYNPEFYSLILERESDGVLGIHYEGSTETEAYELISELIDYLEEDKTITPDKPSMFLPIQMIPLPPDTPSWFSRGVPYVWNGNIIVSKDSLSYFQELYDKLGRVYRETKSGIVQINQLVRATACKEIIDELRRKLGTI